MNEGAQDQNQTPESKLADDGQTRQNEGAQDQNQTPDLPKYTNQLPKDFVESNKELLSKYNSIPEVISALLGKDDQHDADVEYSFTKAWDSPEYEGIDDVLKAAFKDVKLRNEDADKLHSAFMEAISKNKESFAERVEKERDEVLKMLFKDKYDTKMEEARKMYDSLIEKGSDIEKAAQMSLLDKNPVFWYVLSSITDKYAPSVPPNGNKVAGTKQNSGGLLRWGS